MNPPSPTDKIVLYAASTFALLTGTFHILNVSGILVLSAMIVRIVHLMMMLSIVFITRPTAKRMADRPIDLVIRLVLFAVSVAASIYMLLRWEPLALNGGMTTSLDGIAGIVLTLIVLEATRRGVGLVLAIISLVFLSYPFICPYLPGVFYGRAFGVNRIFTFLSTTSAGIYGIPIGVSATYIILFTIYGGFLSEFGAGDFFFKISRKLTRRMTASSAKTAVLFSTLVGMISGSAAGNVAVAGSFTIPLMKRSGYKSHEAGAIEACSSTGGQIMPPVMGAAAFIMAEIIGRPYVDIMKAAIVPALLFFTSIFFVVHLQGLRNGLRGEKKGTAHEDEEKTSKILIDGIPFIIPFGALIAMLVMGYSPFKASFYSILALVAIQIVVDLAVKHRLSLELVWKVGRSIIRGTRSAVPIAIACAAAGIIAGILSVTGLGAQLSGMIVTLSGGIAIVALVLTMVTAIILGMGLPTTAAYLILATVVAPALVKMGVPLLTSHMFVFFYGCVSTITPPVALASYVAAGIAEADINKVGWTAFRFGLTSYILPFMFFFGPALMLQGSVVSVITTIIMSVLGVFSIAVGITGYLRLRLRWWHRLLALAAGLLMIYQGLITDAIGICVLVVVYLLSVLMERNRHHLGPTAA